MQRFFAEMLFLCNFVHICGFLTKGISDFLSFRKVCFCFCIKGLNHMERHYFAKERRTLILNELKKKGKVKVAELARDFKVTEVSIRKDLEELENRKLLIRVKGGAVSIYSDSQYDDRLISEKALLHQREKMNLGAFAASLVQDGESLIIDSGTTMMQVARFLDSNLRLTIITNALDIAMSLYKKSNFQVIVLGGTMRKTSFSTVGLLSEANLKNFYTDKLFLGVDSVSIRDGISTPDIEEASLNQAMLGCAREVIAVFDSSKVNQRSFAHIALLDKVDTIVTDNRLPDELRDYIQLKGIKLHVVSMDEA